MPSTLDNRSAATDTAPTAPPDTPPAPTAEHPRVALVSGAARGIGAAVAAELHATGALVALLDRDDEGVRRTAFALDPTGRTALPLAADVSDTPALRAAVARVTEHWRAPDILVNNAALSVPASIWDVREDEWDTVMAVNLRGVLQLTRLCAPAMRDRGWGRVVNVTSLAGQQGGRLMGPHYSASKAGILVLTKIFARELAGHGVTVNAVAPAVIETPVMDGLGAEERAAMSRAIPVGRLGQPAEVAALAAYLASDAAGYVTGATFDINGGSFMR
ncbi:SDR family oxidoreductase [Streptomyces sp. J2-1]|uniref:SDR family oxidoreductase n=1 Tax=Streptomyces corallincola TaxID=2851888 RepID=UPI001C38AA5E|nr:SDR family NAD(P)-dependent oxidoreductase [Streptomyces corallincola]MBV2357151.1 SDR family oxidoreductase [Streptomyces corallincola]